MCGVNNKGECEQPPSPGVLCLYFLQPNFPCPGRAGGGVWECVSLQSFSTMGTTHLVAKYLLWVHNQILIAWSSLGWDHGGTWLELSCPMDPKAAPLAQDRLLVMP